jgi:hypothetical protein
LVDSIRYIRVQDISETCNFERFPGADGYDLDGIDICNLSPLSIELSSFLVKYRMERLNVLFETLSEDNTDRFIVQYSTNAVDFNDLIEFDGAGMSSMKRIYEKNTTFIPSENVTYFRLNEIDLNGKEIPHTIIAVYTPVKDSNGNEIKYDLSGRVVDSGTFLLDINH